MATIPFPIGPRWTVEELVKLLSSKLDDHDVLIELRTVYRGMHDEMRTLSTGMTTTLQDHEERLRVLENRQVYWLGGMAAAAAIGGTLFKVFGGKFGI